MSQSPRESRHPPSAFPNPATQLRCRRTVAHIKAIFAKRVVEPTITTNKGKEKSVQKHRESIRDALKEGVWWLGGNHLYLAVFVLLQCTLHTGHIFVARQHIQRQSDLDPFVLEHQEHHRA
jgi:hypothetical protein